MLLQTINKWLGYVGLCMVVGYGEEEPTQVRIMRRSSWGKKILDEARKEYGVGLFPSVRVQDFLPESQVSRRLVEPVTLAGIVVYKDLDDSGPNPVTTRIQITGDSDMGEITLYDTGPDLEWGDQVRILIAPVWSYVWDSSPDDRVREGHGPRAGYCYRCGRPARGYNPQGETCGYVRCDAGEISPPACEAAPLEQAPKYTE